MSSNFNFMALITFNNKKQLFKNLINALRVCVFQHPRVYFVTLENY